MHDSADLSSPTLMVSHLLELDRYGFVSGTFLGSVRA